MDMIEVNVVSKEMIKPSSPTPSHLRRFNFSIIDQFAPPIYTPMIYFYYPRNEDSPSGSNPNTISSKLKHSLSQTLTHFYPLAGRVRENLYVECNDEGALFSEARVNCRLVDFLNAPHLEALNKLLPIQTRYTTSVEEAVQVAAQVNEFSCGGIAIGVSFLHKLADGTLLGAFMKRWASISFGSYEIEHHSPHDYEKLSLLFPAVPNLPPNNAYSLSLTPSCSNIQSERFVFSPDSVSRMKAKASSVTVPNPTSIEAITAFIWKHVVYATLKSCTIKPSAISHAMNVRRRMEPDIPEYCLGNALVRVFACADDVTDITSESKLVEIIRKSFLEIDSHYIKSLQGKKGLDAISRHLEEIKKFYAKYSPNFFSFTDWSKFGSYNVDFGWEKPCWVSPSRAVSAKQVKNSSILTESVVKGGVEVWLVLDEEQMKILKQDQEFLVFASINPPVVRPDTI